MKTGMEWPLAALFVLFAVMLAFSMWSSAQVDLAAAQVSALAAGEQLPPTAIPLAELGASWIIKAIFGAILAGFGVALAAKVWALWKKRKYQNMWQPGPNANYQQRAPQIKAPSDAELMWLMMYQQMAAQSGNLGGARMVKQNDDDEEDFTF